MTVTTSYPGVYIEEVPSGVRTIMGVATSITAFLGVAPRGPVGEATTILSWAEYETKFGGLAADSMMSYAVQQYFANGGSQAIIVRVFKQKTSGTTSDPGVAVATLDDASASPSLKLQAASPGAWGNRLYWIVDYDTSEKGVVRAGHETIYNLTIREVDESGNTVSEEVFRNLSNDPASAQYVVEVLANQSMLVENKSGTTPAATLPKASTTDANGYVATQFSQKGNDGDAPGAAEYTPTDTSTRQGLYALDTADLFNLLCIPPPPGVNDTPTTVLVTANTYCASRRAILLLDPPSTWTSRDAASQDKDETGANAKFMSSFTYKQNAAVYFPRLQLADPLQNYMPSDFVPCGVVAGVIARTDATRGVWKAPAGLDAGLTGVTALDVKLNDADNGVLNPLGINCFRTLPAVGNVIWGARTIAGADRLGSEWKYLPVRRLALFLEESLYRGCQWVVFEPNDEPLWAQIRLNVGSFMHEMFRKGAFQGSSPKEAYFVKCDKETTTQADIDRGIVNILVGFAPLKPAEFVIIKLQQMAGQLAT